MIHLAGANRAEKLRRALDELTIYEEEGVDGAIIEDYHGDFRDVRAALLGSRDHTIIRGVNILKGRANPFDYATLCGGKFVQLDNIQTPDLDLDDYNKSRKQLDVSVFGGVRFKYTRETGNPLEQDLREAQTRCEAIVTTGAGTGIETPLVKLKEFRAIMGNFPLIVGAGVTASNVYGQLIVTDGAIVGSYFKPNGDTQLPVDRAKVRELMEIVRGLR